MSNNTFTKVHNWEGLIGQISKDGRLHIIEMDNGSVWIQPIDESKWKAGVNSQYLSTHTFYRRHVVSTNRILKKYGFDIRVGEYKSDKEKDGRCL